MSCQKKVSHTPLMWCIVKYVSRTQPNVLPTPSQKIISHTTPIVVYSEICKREIASNSPHLHKKERVTMTTTITLSTTAARYDEFDAELSAAPSIRARKLIIRIFLRDVIGANFDNEEVSEYAECEFTAADIIDDLDIVVLEPTTEDIAREEAETRRAEDLQAALDEMEDPLLHISHAYIDNAYVEFLADEIADDLANTGEISDKHQRFVVQAMRTSIMLPRYGFTLRHTPALAALHNRAGEDLLQLAEARYATSPTTVDMSLSDAIYLDWLGYFRREGVTVRGRVHLRPKPDRITHPCQTPLPDPLDPALTAV